MKPRRTTAVEAPIPCHVVLVTMDGHLAGAATQAARQLATLLPGLRLSVHAASDWAEQPVRLQQCIADIGTADLLIVTMLFMEEHYLPVLPALKARRLQCDAIAAAMSAPAVTRLTRMGRLDMDAPTSGPMALLKRLRGKPQGEGQAASAGQKQMAMLRRLPKLLRFIPGTAQDLRAYFLLLQYWLAGSTENLVAMVQLLLERYAAGPRAELKARCKAAPPVEYPELGVYHPRLPQRLGLEASELPQGQNPERGTVGLLLLRSYLLAGNTAHYDGVIAALEARGLAVRPCFATGLDARPAVERFFLDAQGRATVDAVVSLTGFSLVGGPAYNDARAAEELLATLDVPYLSALPVEFQSLQQWGASSRGLTPLESTMMIAIPELDGSGGSMVYGGRSSGGSCTGCARNCHFEAESEMHACPERAGMLAARVARWVSLRRKPREQRRIGIVIFNFPPNSGATGTAAHLGVFESLFNTLGALRADGYRVEMPASVEQLRERLIVGNAARYGAAANVHARISTAEQLQREPHLRAIEAQWGPAPGRQQSDGQSIQVLGERFGEVFVGIQPAFGKEGDPMKLLFEQDFAPTHAFSAFYRWLREDFGADALLHFGTHGALEFMPGKQSGLSGDCWPERLLQDLPNVYLYAANNPSEGTLAKRRASAVMVSHLTPPVTESGLYQGLAELKTMLDRWRALPPGTAHDVERDSLAPLLQQQAKAMELCTDDDAWSAASEVEVQRLLARLQEVEATWIPQGLHVVGRPPSAEARAEWLRAAEPTLSPADATRLATGEALPGHEALVTMNRQLATDSELPALLHALNGGYLRPAPGGDVLRNPEVLPTGRNLHGFDPSRLPSRFAVMDGARQAERLLQRHQADGNAFPESIAMVLWGTDNLKTEGGPIAQALALMGALPRFDHYGRLAGAQLTPLAELGRPRVDVMVTLSGIFRDLLPLQIRLLAEAAFLAASADEPDDQNFIRKHALAYQREHGGTLETASLRVFGNADGAYGANLGHLIDSGAWGEADELAETYTRRKGFAYGVNGRPVVQRELLDSVLRQVELAYQNLDSVELGVTSVDTYFDTLGGISRAVQRAKQQAGGGTATAPVYIGDQTQGSTVRLLSEQVALEAHTRLLNPKWFEPMLDHGYEGVRQIEAHLTHTLGWSATTGQVQPWVYQRLSETFVLDAAMRERLAKLNPTASARMANRLLEASDRQFWQPDASTLAALREAGDELEDRLEGVFTLTPQQKAAA